MSFGRGVLTDMPIYRDTICTTNLFHQYEIQKIDFLIKIQTMRKKLQHLHRIVIFNKLKSQI